MEKLRGAFHDLRNFGYSQAAPAASVYQTAIQIKSPMMLGLDESIGEDGEPRWFYRGQRCAQWLTVPSIYRELGDVHGAESEYISQVSRIRGVVRALKSVGIASEDFHALPIAQHYSNELGVRTWLIDVTVSPYIALFFASDGGQDDNIEALTYMERTDWLFWVEGAPDSIGRLRSVSLAGIPRIENQAAFFIEAPHPELFRQMSNVRFYFRQRSGVVFEDTSLDPPASRERIYPQHDPILERLPRDWDTQGCVPLTWEPALNTLKEPDEAVFEDLARPWLEHANYTQLHVIAAVCRLHAAVTRHKTTLPHYIGTLHHLQRIVKSVLAPRLPQYEPESRIVEDLLEMHYIKHIRAPDVADDFAKCIVEACPEWEPIARKLLEPALTRRRS